MSRRYIKMRLQGLEKRLLDLHKRKSHAAHETQIAFSELAKFSIEIPWSRPLLKIRSASLCIKLARLHNECCEINLDE